MSGAFEDEELISRINVTPLVDVVLVLLVVLMVSATAALSLIPVHVPGDASPGESVTLSVSITVAGKLHVDGQRMSDAELRVLLRTSPRASVILTADGRTDHATVVRVMDLLRREGVQNIAINPQ